jgi:hypothetical protein
MGDCHISFITKSKKKIHVRDEMVGKAQVHKLYYTQRPHICGIMVMTNKEQAYHKACEMVGRFYMQGKALGWGYSQNKALRRGDIEFGLAF